ncbi:hypothetical protein DZB84_03050 [Bacillus sp. HNG]|uniref:YbxH family protein n=1 Tax=Bacillus sp. HNG TaxID=2293325 RepID=UPI000E2EC70D|nr:YbxH family protein [Bacillus sp. HNG]RFB19248.1 hypothetical protein DZB84_03050 [Bacillus sp. HNG]
MGAIDRDGYRFETEYSVISQKGAIHVYRDGEFIKELTFSFTGEQPVPSLIEEVVDEFFETSQKCE